MLTVRFCADFAVGFAAALSQHVARVAAWVVASLFAGALLGVRPSWGVVGLLVASNVIGALVCPREVER